MTPMPKPGRLESIDLLRGLVMIVMALDHVRDFFSDRLYLDVTDLTKTTPGLFFTRWITHYCAPTFIFLAGTSAFLARTRGKSTVELSVFLCTRGLWLAFFELVINRAMWMFNFDPIHHGAGVFWAIGWAMIVLSLLIYLPTAAVTFFGVVTVVSHNVLDGLNADQVHLPRWLWTILHSPGDAPLFDDYTFGTGYCLIPWVGVMAAGYGFGGVMVMERTIRRRRLFLIGGMLTLGFVVLRGVNVYGDPRPWEVQSSPLWTLMSFLNCTKYPASLDYLLMTLGPAILALGVFDRPVGVLARPVITIGRVPFFYYLLHIPLIHGGAVLLDYVRFGWSPLAKAGPWTVEPNRVPVNYGVDLPTVYLIWIGVVLVLYWPCRWFAGVKQRRRDVWLSYL